MTDEEILKKVVKKAIKGGWENHYETLMAPTADKEWLEKYLIASQEYRLFIFSHDFAKAFFWGTPTLFLICWAKRHRGGKKVARTEKASVATPSPADGTRRKADIILKEIFIMYHEKEKYCTYPQCSCRKNIKIKATNNPQRFTERSVLGQRWTQVSTMWLNFNITNISHIPQGKTQKA